MMENRQFEPDINETEYLCRGCGYNTTDLERSLYGQVAKDDDGNITLQYHWCTFCCSAVPMYKKWFKNIDDNIQIAKIKLLYKYVETTERYNVQTKLDNLLTHHAEDALNPPYITDDNGMKIVGEYEHLYNNHKHHLLEILNAPRHLYLESLEGFGGSGDTAPCTRNLADKQKRKLLKLLKNIL